MVAFGDFCVALRDAAAAADAAVAAFDAAAEAGTLEGLDALRIAAEAAVAWWLEMKEAADEWRRAFKWAGEEEWKARRAQADQDILELAASLAPARRGVRVERTKRASRPMPLYRGWQALAFGLASGFSEEENGKLLELFGEKRKLPYWTAMKEIAGLTTGGGWVGFLVDASPQERAEARAWADARLAALRSEKYTVVQEFDQVWREGTDGPSPRYWSDFGAQKRIAELEAAARAKTKASKADLSALRGLFGRA
ncbi:hypothetical protein EBT31_06490 [bacterium]|nr:hypothetical protein [bacterium]